MKWIGQRKRNCIKCRATFPDEMAKNPRINLTLVSTIRLAKVSRTAAAAAAGSSSNVYHFVRNENRPDKAFTTERAKLPGHANVASGKIYVTTPSDHFGPIPAENDPVRNQGLLVGESWKYRIDCRQWGAHYPTVAGIAGQSKYGAQSVALAGGYDDDEDHGEWFLYTGRFISFLFAFGTFDLSWFIGSRLASLSRFCLEYFAGCITVEEETSAATKGLTKSSRLIRNLHTQMKL